MKRKISKKAWTYIITIVITMVLSVVYYALYNKGEGSLISIDADKPMDPFIKSVLVV